MAHETDRDWEIHKLASRKLIEETDYVIAGGNKFLGIENTVKSVKECSNNLEKLIDGRKFKSLSDEEKIDQGRKFIDNAMDSIYELGNNLGSTYVEDSDSMHMLKTIHTQFRNENLQGTIHDLFNTSSTELDELGTYIDEHQDLNFDYF